MNAIVTTDKVGHNLRVLVDGVEVKSFHEISDDYAYTNCSDYARELKLALPLCDTIRDACNLAWKNL